MINFLHLSSMLTLPEKMFFILAALFTAGLVLRAEPDINALILAYLNQGDQVTLLGTQQLAGGLVWEFVRISAGQEGWVTASYLQTPTPQE